MEFWDYWLFYTQKYGEKNKKQKLASYRFSACPKGIRQNDRRGLPALSSSLCAWAWAHTHAQIHTQVHTLTPHAYSHRHTHIQMRTHTCSHLRKMRKKESSIWIT